MTMLRSSRLLIVLALLLKTCSILAFSPPCVGATNKPAFKPSSSLFMEAEIFTGSMPGGFNSRKKSSRTARESAVLVDWERRSELERRVEDGIHYEHFPEMSDSYFGTQVRRKHKSSGPSNARVTDSGALRGVFCGMKGTKEEYERLRSASVED